MNCKMLFEYIDSLNSEYLDFLEDVCNIESPTDFKEGVDQVGKYFAEKAKEKGWRVEVYPQPVSGDIVFFDTDDNSVADIQCRLCSFFCCICRYWARCFLLYESAGLVRPE